MKKPTTIVDVARQAGVSKSTVSRAMHGSREISAPTERRIRAIARQMGYRPNMLFSVMGAGNRKPGRGGLLPLACHCKRHLINVRGDGSFPRCPLTLVHSERDGPIMERSMLGCDSLVHCAEGAF